MMYNNQQQLHQFEEEMFHTALLGLLEIEGRRLMLENEHLKKRRDMRFTSRGRRAWHREDAPPG